MLLIVAFASMLALASAVVVSTRIAELPMEPNSADQALLDFVYGLVIYAAIFGLVCLTYYCYLHFFLVEAAGTKLTPSWLAILGVAVGGGILYVLVVILLTWRLVKRNQEPCC